jgi:hypothetical protein
MSDFTIQKDEQRSNNILKDEQRTNNILIDKNNEKWSKSGIDTAGWWSLKYLWSYPTKEEAYNHIEKDLEKRGAI